MSRKIGGFDEAAAQPRSKTMVRLVFPPPPPGQAVPARPVKVPMRLEYMVPGLHRSYLRLAGDKERFDKEIEALRKFRNFLNSSNSAEVLLLNGLPQEAIALLTEDKNFSRAIEILLAQGKYREAMAVADKAKSKGPPDLRLKINRRGRCTTSGRSRRPRRSGPRLPNMSRRAELTGPRRSQWLPRPATSAPVAPPAQPASPLPPLAPPRKDTEPAEPQKEPVDPQLSDMSLYTHWLNSGVRVGLEGTSIRAPGADTAKAGNQQGCAGVS